MALKLASKPNIIDSMFLFAAGPFSPTPTLGAEILADPGLEATYTAGLCDSLGSGGTITPTQSADVHGGSKAQQMVGVLTNARLMYQFITVVKTWYQAFIWAKRTAGTTAKTFSRVGSNDGVTMTPLVAITAASYAQMYATFRATTTASMMQVIDVPSPGDTVIVDDYSAKAITLASMFSLVGDPGEKNGDFDIEIPTLAIGTPAGDAICLDSVTSPLWYLHRYHDGTNFHLDKVENGTPTSLIDTAQTWGATVKYRIKKRGSSISCFADNVQIGTTQTVDTSSGYGTKWAAFSTLATNAVKNFSWELP